jgi:hypothetical protein
MSFSGDKTAGGGADSIGPVIGLNGDARFLAPLAPDSTPWIDAGSGDNPPFDSGEVSNGVNNVFAGNAFLLLEEKTSQNYLMAHLKPLCVKPIIT